MKSLIFCLSFIISHQLNAQSTGSDPLNIDIVSFDSIQKMGYERAITYNNELLELCFEKWGIDSVYVKEKLSNVKDNYIIIGRTYSEDPNFSQNNIDEKIEEIQNLTGITNTEKESKCRGLIYKGKEAYNNKEYKVSSQFFLKAKELGYYSEEIDYYLNKLEKKLKKQHSK